MILDRRILCIDISDISRVPEPIGAYFNLFIAEPYAIIDEKRCRRIRIIGQELVDVVIFTVIREVYVLVICADRQEDRGYDQEY